jgi:C4-dicarboxylate transporter DctM subunit
VVSIVAVLFSLLLVLGSPVSFSMGLAAAAAIAYQGSMPMAILIQRMLSGVDGFIFVAVPFYILAGALMDSGGITVRLVRLAQALLGHIRGGLGMVVVLAEYLFSGISGSVVADTSAVGGVVLPLMRKSGYSGPLSVAIVSASSAMGILVPPCIPMIVMAGMVNLSVAALFAGGFLPAAVLAVMLMVLIYLQARRERLPAGERANWRQVKLAFREAIIPLGMPIVIFGGILGGIVTATEAGAIAVAYGAVAGILIYKEIPLRKVPSILLEVAVTNGIVMLLASTAMVLAYILAIQRVPDTISQFLRVWASAPFVFLLFTILLFVVFGGLLEGLPAIVIFVPILDPVARSLGISSLHFGLVAIGSIGVGLFLPPAGLGLFVACGIARVPMESVIRPFMPFAITLIVGLILISAVPWFTLVLPRLLNLG